MGMNCSRRVPPIIGGVKCPDPATLMPRILGWARPQKDHTPLAMDFPELSVCGRHGIDLNPEDFFTEEGWSKIQASLVGAGRAPLIWDTLELKLITIH